MKRILVFFLTAVFLCACVPTPEQEYVISKRDDVTDTAVLQTAEPNEAHETLAERIGAPAHWTEEPYSVRIPFDTTLTVHIDADVHVPDTERVGVYTVEYAALSETLQKGLVLKLLSDREKPFLTEQNGKTARRWEYLENIKYYQDELERLRQSDDPEMREVMTKQIEEQLETAMEHYRDAPDDLDRVPWDGTYLKGSGLEAGTLRLNVSTEEQTHYRRLILSAYGLDYRDETLPLSPDYDTQLSGDKSERTAVRTEPETDAERDAAAFASEFVNSLGLGTFTVKCVSQGMDGFVLSNRRAENGYFVQLWLTKDGLPFYNFQAWRGEEPAAASAAQANQTQSDNYSGYMPEQASAFVGVKDGKLARLSIEGLPQETGCVNENAQLLPFSEIQKIFKEQIAYHYWSGDWENRSGDEYDEHLYITDVYLSMLCVRKKDAPDTFYLLPVWDFGCYRVNKWMRSDTAEEAAQNRAFMRVYSAMTINAIDGTIIDRSVGY